MWKLIYFHAVIFAFAGKAYRFAVAPHLFVFFHRNNGEFGAKIYFTDLRTANTIQFFVAIKGNFSGSSYLEQIAEKGEFLKRLLAKCSHQFICISLK